MIKPLYILSASAVSAQDSFDASNFLVEQHKAVDGYLYVVDADYRKYISPVAIRRMSKLLKMSLTAGMQALNDAAITQPDAIITGTGRGSVSDMEHFLKDMISMQEQALNPTFFIQSTYNSTNGWLALMTKATCYNQTYVHRSSSFELAMIDAQLLLSEASTTQHILVGGFDEMTDYYYMLKNKNHRKVATTPDGAIIEKLEGTLSGEGATFFTVSNEQKDANTAVIDIKSIYKPSSADLQKDINDMLAAHQLSMSSIDLMLLGCNGDHTFDAFYAPFTQNSENTWGCYKDLCGEYDTASGFALWLANYIFTTQSVPVQVLQQGTPPANIRHILIINHSFAGDAALMLLQSCK